MRVNEFEDWLKLNIDAENTRQNYLYRVSKFFQCYKEFNQQTITRYLAQRIDEKVSKSTFNGDLASFKAYAKFLKVEIEFPKQKFIGKKIHTFLTEEEIEKEIFPYFSVLFTDYEYSQFIIRMLFYTGIRPRELVYLQVQDIAFDKPILTIREPKNKHDRYVPYPPKLKSNIKRYLNAEGKAFDITYRQIKYIFDKINEELGYKKYITPYALRHGYGRYMVRQGYNLKLIQKFMGHSDIKITDIYTDITPEEAIKQYFERKSNEED